MKILWEKPDTASCWKCDGRHFKITSIHDDWVDYECLMCHQEDAMLRDDFIEFIKAEMDVEETNR